MVIKKTIFFSFIQPEENETPLVLQKIKLESQVTENMMRSESVNYYQILFKKDTKLRYFEHDTIAVQEINSTKNTFVKNIGILL